MTSEPGAGGTPGTEAGRALQHRLEMTYLRNTTPAILAIEAEAIYIGAMAERERIVRAVEGLPSVGSRPISSRASVYRAAVLAILRDEP